MPDRLLNPYQYQYKSPIGDALRQFGDALMSGPTEAQRISQAEQALKLKRTREGEAEFSNMVRSYGTPGYDPKSVAAVFAGYGGDPQKLAEYQRFLAANVNGATAPETTNAFVGAGGAYGATPMGYREGQATEIQKTRMNNDRALFEFNNKPYVVGSETGPVVMRQSESYGRPAVEDIGKVRGDVLRRAINDPGGLAAQPIEVQRLVGAEGKSPGTPRNYVLNGQTFITNDGITDARTNQPLPPGGYLATAQGSANDVGLRPNVEGGLQNQEISLKRLNSVADYARSLIVPQNVGIPGYVKGAAQDMVQVAKGLADGLGVRSAQDALEDIKRRAAERGADPNTMAGLFSFDPRLPQLHTAYYGLVMAGADALAGGINKASDKDIRIVKGMLGDPNELFASAESLNAKLDGVRAVTDRLHAVNQESLRRPIPGMSPAAPGAAAPPTQEKTFLRGPDGQLRRVQ